MDKLNLTPEITSAYISKKMGRHDPVANAAVFAIMRALKTRNPGDTYLDAYLWHYQKYGRTFFDYYHLLWMIGSDFNINRILEIGCRTGISICQFLSAMDDPSVPQVHLFDIFDDGFISPHIVKSNMKHLGLPTEKVTFYKGDSAITIPQFSQSHDAYSSFDYILVDGNHDKAAAVVDLENVVPLLRPGGVLFFDDIAPDGCDLIDVWDRFKAVHNREFNFFENMDGKGIGVGVKL